MKIYLAERWIGEIKTPPESDRRMVADVELNGDLQWFETVAMPPARDTLRSITGPDAEKSWTAA